MPKEYYHTKESVSEYIKMAQDVDSGELIGQLRVFLDAESEVLELGSGPGTDFKLLQKYYRVTGSDYSEEFLLHLKAKFPKEAFLRLNAVTMQTENKFNGIYANKVLHHLTDSELSESLQAQHRTLHQEGIVCHSYWKGEGFETFKGMFVNYHVKNTLEAFYKPYFDLLVNKEYEEFEPSDSILIIAKKKN